MKRTKLDDRVLPVYTKGEEIFNMVTHIVGGAMGIAALVLCIIFCHDGYGLFSGIVYGISMILLYTMSAIYHGLSPKLKAKKVFQIMDHCSIFMNPVEREHFYILIWTTSNISMTDWDISMAISC